MTTPYHIPALLPQALDALAIRPDGVYVDVTLGGGGHTRAILQRLSTGGHLFSMDQDMDAIVNAPEDSRLTAVLGNFRYVENFMRYYGHDSVDGILADLGVSFHHFDTAERGFSFRLDSEAPLDMRMNRTAPRSAADLLAQTDEGNLERILRTYGELKDARRIARAIIAREGRDPIRKVGDLTSVVEPLLNPARAKKELSCIFQALRIAVNDEMGALEELLSSSLRILRPGGRLAVITYHSLEDRMVKNFMRTGDVSLSSATTDLFGRSCAPLRPIGKVVTPDAAEVEANPRSRSAKLRTAEKLAES